MARKSVPIRKKEPTCGKRVESPERRIDREREQPIHQQLESRVVELCRKNDLQTFTNRHIDVLARSNSTAVVFEIKTTGILHIQDRIRTAVTQLLEYKYLYREILSPDVRLCIVADRRPRGASKWLMGYVDSLDIGLIWKNDGDADFSCGLKTKQLLGDVLHSLRDWKMKMPLWR